jgi:Rab guanine nucleotide exchange factor SEC2
MEPAEAKEAEEKPSDDPVDDKVAKPRTPEEPASVDGENPADVSVSAKTTPPEEDAVTAPVNLENETAPTSAVEEAKAQEDTENTVVPTTTTPEPVAEEKPVLPTIQTDTPLASLEKEEKDAVNTDDTEVYVGEGTWEERTWKELTRLREDMFWARVGGVR